MHEGDSLSGNTFSYAEPAGTAKSSLQEVERRQCVVGCQAGMPGKG